MFYIHICMWRQRWINIYVKMLHWRSMIQSYRCKCNFLQHLHKLVNHLLTTELVRPVQMIKPVKTYTECSTKFHGAIKPCLSFGQFIIVTLICDINWCDSFWSHTWSHLIGLLFLVSMIFLVLHLLNSLKFKKISIHGNIKQTDRLDRQIDYYRTPQLRCRSPQ